MSTSNPSNGNIPLLSFLFEARDEIKKVTWPNKDQIIRLTTIVVIACFGAGIYLGGLDYTFTWLLGVVLNK